MFNRFKADRVGSGRAAARRRYGFTLVELLVALAVLAMLVGVLLPVAGASRQLAQTNGSFKNLRVHGWAAASYAADNGDRVLTYSWRPGQTYEVVGELNPVYPRDAVDAAGWQATDILRRLTGRASGTDQIKHLVNVLPNRRFGNLVLFDYLGLSLPQGVSASPLDRRLIKWQGDPLDESQWPTSSEDSSTFVTSKYRPRWPYSSSYQVVPAAWSPDVAPTVAPVLDTTNFFATPSDALLGDRRYAEVAFPSQKVHMFEEFDFVTDRRGVFYAYDVAQSTTLMFDGSVRSDPTTAANIGWNPDQPQQIGFKSEYKPMTNLHPDAFYADRYKNLVYGWYRWTRMGLGGIDYDGPEVGLPSTTRAKRSFIRSKRP